MSRRRWEGLIETPVAAEDQKEWEGWRASDVGIKGAEGRRNWGGRAMKMIYRDWKGLRWTSVALGLGVDEMTVII
jgi:hypothetical protein